jgi:hypothetical protein
MHKFSFSCILLFFIAVQTVHAQSDNRLQFIMNYGYQQENLHWSIAGNSNGTSPNIYSELQWKHYSGFASGASLQWRLVKGLVVAGGFSRLQIGSGKVDDTDYAQDNRTNAVYAGHFDGDKGYSSAYHASAGYIFKPIDKFRFTLYLGYIINRQSLYILDNTRQINGLNSTYITDWKGPFVKADVSYNITSHFLAGANIQ